MAVEIPIVILLMLLNGGRAQETLFHGAAEIRGRWNWKDADNGLDPSVRMGTDLYSLYENHCALYCNNFNTTLDYSLLGGLYEVTARFAVSGGSSYLTTVGSGGQLITFQFGLPSLRNVNPRLGVYQYYLQDASLWPVGGTLISSAPGFLTMNNTVSSLDPLRSLGNCVVRVSAYDTGYPRFTDFCELQGNVFLEFFKVGNRYCTAVQAVARHFGFVDVSPHSLRWLDWIARKIR